MAKNIILAFSNREIAIVVWIFIAIIWVVIKTDTRKSLLQLLKAFFAKKLALSYLLMLAYIASIIFLLNMIGVWKVSDASVTILWFLGIAFVMLFQFSKANEPNFFKNAIQDNLKCLIIIEFIINFYVFKLWIELLIVPFFILIGGMMAIADTDKSYKIVKKLLNGIMAIFGIFSLSYAIYMLVTDFENFATFGTYSNFYLPILLSIMFLPFVYFIALYASYETLFIRLGFFVENKAVLAYAKKKTFLNLNLNLWKLNHWGKYINTSWRFKKTSEVDEAIKKFRALQHVEIIHKSIIR